MSWEIRQGDCLALMAAMPAASVDAIVTDPPYGLGFMGKAWDHGVPGEPFWSEALRVAKPGAHLLAFGGTRTYHRLACAIEDAGFEIRDSLMWLYGSGFPKSLDVSKAIDKAAGAKREKTTPRQKIGTNTTRVAQGYRPNEVAQSWNDAGPATDAARSWSGWGTALKPAYEPIILARKPLSGTVAANVLAHGTGALNIDGCRIGTTDSLGGGANVGMTADTRHEGFARPWMRDAERRNAAAERSRQNTARAESLGRWPANVLLDDDAARMLDEQSGERQAGGFPEKIRGASPIAFRSDESRPERINLDSGGASRFFYTSKASSAERHYAGRNAHPTVKPIDLMRWLVRLVTPPRGLVLDPFCGSGSTGIAALGEGFRFIGIEIDPESAAQARKRIAGPLFAGTSDEASA